GVGAAGGDATHGLRGQRLVGIQLDDVAPAVEADPRGRTHQPAPSLSFSKPLTIWGLARPRVSFITWPTRKPRALSLPALKSATGPGLAAITRSITWARASWSEIWRRPRAST